MSDYSTIPTSHCPQCGKHLDSATGIGGDAAPIPGDICVCIQCLELNVFNDDLTLHQMTEDEYAELCADPELYAQINYTRYLLRKTLKMTEFPGKTPPQ